MHPGGGPEGLLSIEAWAGRPLPSYYRAFLLAHPRGLQGELACLYGLDIVLERNVTYEVRTYCPGYFALGDDSGGRAIVAALDDEHGRLFLVDHGDMTPSGLVLLADDFETWLAGGSVIR